MESDVAEVNFLNPPELKEEGSAIAETCVVMDAGAIRHRLRIQARATDGIGGERSTYEATPGVQSG
jgi:hypothetical protein